LLSPSARQRARISARLVADAFQIVAQLLDGVDGVASLYGLRVVRNEESLCGFANDNAFLALSSRLLSADMFFRRKALRVETSIYLLAIERLVVRSNGHIFLACQNKSLTLDGLDR
jgi:hypothetical protein